MILSYAGSFAAPTSTGNYVVTGVGFQGKIVLFFATDKTANGTAANGTYMIGSAISSSSRRVSCGSVQNGSNPNKNVETEDQNTFCIDIMTVDATTGSEHAQPAPNTQADFVSWNSDGFTVNFTTVDASNARIINFLVLGGPDLTNVFLGSGTTPNPAATGTKAYTGVGFKPDALILFRSRFDVGETLQNLDGSNTFTFGMVDSALNQGCSSVRNKAGGSVAKHVQATGKCLTFVGSAAITDQAGISSLDSDGFTLNWTTSGNAGVYFYYIALKGGAFKVGTFNQPTSNGVQRVATALQPTALLMSSCNAATAAGFQGNARVSFGVAASPSQRFTTFWGDTDTSVPTVVSQNMDRTKALSLLTEGASPTTNASADLLDFNNNAFNLNWSTTDATAREIIYLAIGSLQNKPISTVNYFNKPLRPRIFGPGLAR